MRADSGLCLPVVATAPAPAQRPRGGPLAPPSTEKLALETLAVLTRGKRACV